MIRIIRDRRLKKWADRLAVRRQAEQAMSCPQHNGDLIMPWSLGHFETCTSVLSSSVILPSSSGASHLPQLVLTLMPQTSHS